MNRRSFLSMLAALFVLKKRKDSGCMLGVNWADEMRRNQLRDAVRGIRRRHYELYDVLHWT